MAIGPDGKIDNTCDTSQSTERLIERGARKRLNHEARIDALAEVVRRLVEKQA